MISGVAVHLEDLPGLVEVVLYDRQVLAHLVARHRVSLAVVAVALERAHPLWRGGAVFANIHKYERVVHQTHGQHEARRGRLGFLRDTGGVR